MLMELDNFSTREFLGSRLWVVLGVVLAVSNAD